MSVSEQIPTYPSLNPTFKPLSFYQETVVGLREGYMLLRSYLGTDIDPSILNINLKEM